MICSSILVVVSPMTPAQSNERLAGMTLRTANMPHEGAGEIPTSDPAWRRKDVWLAILFVACVAAVWIAFNG